MENPVSLAASRTAWMPASLPLVEWPKGLDCPHMDVAAHGHTRDTFNVDFLARRAQRNAWFARFTAADLNVFGETPAFAQYGSPELYDTFLRLLRTP